MASESVGWNFKRAGADQVVKAPKEGKDESYAARLKEFDEFEDAFKKMDFNQNAEDGFCPELTAEDAKEREVTIQDIGGVVIYMIYSHIFYFIRFCFN